MGIETCVLVAMGLVLYNHRNTIFIAIDTCVNVFDDETSDVWTNYGECDMFVARTNFGCQNKFICPHHMSIK